jgi:WD40 repeat protein
LLSSFYVIQRARKLVALNNDLFAVAGSDSEVTIWNIKERTQIMKLVGTVYNSLAMVKIQDLLLASSNYDYIFNLINHVKIWNYTSGQLFKNLTGHRRAITDMIGLDNEKVASCSEDKTIRIWNTTSGTCLKTLSGHGKFVMCLALIANHVLVSSSWDNTIRFWNLTTGQHTIVLSAEVETVECLISLNDSTHLASSDREYLIKIWNIKKTPSLITTLEGHTNLIASLVHLKKGHLASASWDMTIKVWNFESLEYGVALLVTLSGHVSQICALILLTDGNLASA